MLARIVPCLPFLVVRGPNGLSEPSVKGKSRNLRRVKICRAGLRPLILFLCTLCPHPNTIVTNATKGAYKSEPL